MSVRKKTLHRIRIISLDLDDTLWAIQPVIQRAEKLLWDWLAEHYPRIAENWTAEDMIQVRSDVVGDFPDMTHDLRFLRKAVLSRVAASAGYTDELVEPAFAVFDKARNEVELFPGVLSELAALSEHYGLIAITNGNANLQTIGIARYFDTIVTSVSAGAAKPSRRIFDDAIRLAGVPAHEILHVGDHPETDIHGAKRSGMRTAWINRSNATWPGEFEEPDVTIRDISDIRDMLQSALAAASDTTR